MKMRKSLALLTALLLCLNLTACGTEKTDGATEPSTTRTTAGERDNNVNTAYPDKVAGFQTKKPAVGEQIAIMHTDEGDIHIRLFPEAAPLAVNNFITLAKEGYYDGLTFHRVIENFMIQSGDPKGDGTGGESATGEDFADEFDAKLLNLSGAVAMANNGEDTNGSQFFINQKSAEDFDRETFTPEYQEAAAKSMYESALQEYSEEKLAGYGISSWEDFITAEYVYDWIPEEVWKAYETHGGNLHLDGAFRRSGGHTVFGHVFEGMDVVEEIAGAITNSNNKPIVDICIKSIEITTYQG